ncbi:uncharacterized protein TRAVEDRAFT_109543 [Trametes versicolor FP-101664 SS1]|uniref:uncharacterized protein n=1 Tax=Trametes versicolor (strain FP-101664) TaxID=717944 RepID=UPI0004623ABC|nr:uncharacterized protein TRAVEDRAFT_109543 [Trametes versicolor FP-101664 SS1]EIW65135.1 hypothetical protein TRAVEDRAFT_109543 [Trametes versicolor FP-101664 SS1]
MHNLFLGELRHHCRDVWGINVKDKSSDSPKLAPHDPDEQQVWLDRVASYVRRGSQARLSKIRKGYIAAVAELNDAMPTASKFAKKDYIASLLQWWTTSPGEIRLPPVLAEPTTEFQLIRDQYDISRFSILDQETVTSLRADIAATSFPSWLERPPRNFGSTSHGKLKADMWRTVCTVSMVITLVRLWGGREATERQRALLENFVHLVSAVDLAARRSTNQERIDKYDRHMLDYLTSLRDLFDHQLVPNHHLSLHLKECLELFGPVSAWWAFPFERFNGLLQRLSTNSQTSDMPLTFMRYFYLGANLRALMEETDWPDKPEFRAMKNAYLDAVRDAVRGTRLADFYSAHGDMAHPELSSVFNEHKLENLPSTIYDTLYTRISVLDGNIFAPIFAELDDLRLRLPLGAQHVSSFAHRGATYATSISSRNNSFVLFDTPGTSVPMAGMIKDIFLHGRLVQGKAIIEPFFVVEEYVPLSLEHATLDPYRRFEDLGTRLFYHRTTETPKLLALQDIRCHFAGMTYTPDGIGEECIVVRSLDRVSVNSTIK